VKHVLNSVLADIETSETFSLFVAITQFGHKNDGVHAGIFCESVGDQFESFTVCSGHIGVGSEDFTGIFLELVRDFHFDAGAAGNERSLLDEGTDDTKSIMEGSVSLIEDELVGTAE